MFTPEKAKEVFEETFDIKQICNQLDKSFEQYLRFGFSQVSVDLNNFQLEFPTTLYPQRTDCDPNHVEGFVKSIPPSVAYKVGCAYANAGWKYVFYNCDIRVDQVMCTYFKLYMDINKVHNSEIDYFTCIQKTDDGKYVENFVSSFNKGD